MTEYDDLTGDPIPTSNTRNGKKTESTPAAPTADDLARINEMGIDALRDLCKRMARQGGLVAAMSDDERKTLAKDRLTRIVQIGDDRDAITAADKVLDRIEGKAAQKLEITLDMVQQFIKEIEGESVLLIE